MRNFLVVLSVVASTAIAAPALADVPPPNSSGCTNKAAGDACQKDDNSDGSCVTETCTKLDYSMGTPPTSVDYDCLLCNGEPSGGNNTPPNDDDGACAVKHGAAAGAAGAWALGAALLLVSRRLRSRNRKSR